MHFPLSIIKSQTAVTTQNTDASTNDASQQRNSMYKRLSVLRKSVKSKPLKENIHTTLTTHTEVQLRNKPAKEKRPLSTFTESRKSFSRSAQRSFKKIKNPMLMSASSGYNNYLDTMKSKIASSHNKHFERISTASVLDKKTASFVDSTKFLSGISVFDLNNNGLMTLLKNSDDYSSLEEFISKYTNAMDKYRPDFSLFNKNEGNFFYENGSLKTIEEGDFLGAYNKQVDQHISQLKEYLARNQRSVINDLTTLKSDLNKDDNKPSSQLRSIHDVIHHDLKTIKTHASNDHHPFQPVKTFHFEFQKRLDNYGTIKQDDYVKARVFLDTYKEFQTNQAPFFNSVFTFQTLVAKLLGKHKV